MLAESRPLLGLGARRLVRGRPGFDSAASGPVVGLRTPEPSNWRRVSRATNFGGICGTHRHKAPNAEHSSRPGAGQVQRKNVQTDSEQRVFVAPKSVLWAYLLSASAVLWAMWPCSTSLKCRYRNGHAPVARPVRGAARLVTKGANTTSRQICRLTIGIGKCTNRVAPSKMRWTVSHAKSMFCLQSSASLSGVLSRCARCSIALCRAIR